MKVSELRTICDALARFATVREKVDDVTSRIGIQAGAGRLKMVAGDGKSGVVVDVMACAERGAFYVDARPLFQGAKVLPAKSEVILTVSQNGLEIKTETGGSLMLKNKGPLSVAGFAKKPDSIGFSTSIDPQIYNQMSKLFTAASKGEEKLSQIVGSIHVDSTSLDITFVEPRVKTKYASWHKAFDYDGEPKVAIADSSFFEALKAVEVNSVLSVSNAGIIVNDGRITIYTSNVQNMEHWPVLAVQGTLNSFEIERKKFIEVLKGQVPNDEHARVVLTWDKDSLEIRPYGSEGGMSLPVATIGKGLRAVNATLLIDMLNGMDDAKKVAVCIAEGSPAIILRAPEYSDWTLLVAPVVM